MAPYTSDRQMRPNLNDSPLLKALAEAAQPIHPILRTAALRRENWTCRYCGARATEVDHVLPRAQGGLTVLANLAAACQHCNREKGNRTPEQWEADKQRQAAQAFALRRRAVKVPSRSLRKARRIPGYRPTQPPPYLAALLRRTNELP